MTDVTCVQDKWFLKSKTLWTTILSLIATWLVSPEFLNIVPPKYLVYIPMVGLAVQSILRSIPSDSQGALTLKKPDQDRVPPTATRTGSDG